jgi:hypothetical protein
VREADRGVLRVRAGEDESSGDVMSLVLDVAKDASMLQEMSFISSSSIFFFSNSKPNKPRD